MKLTETDFAMYLGADYLGEWYGKVRKITLGNISTIVNSNAGTAKPILRPLSDMTDEEAKQCAIILWYNSEEDFNKGYEPFNQQQVIRAKIDIQDGFGRISLPTYNTGFQLFKYLISKHFDVFGWIEKGLALDKTKL